MAKRKVIVTIAHRGMAFKSQNPHLPTQPAEIAEDVYRCYNAGASVVALHARRPDDQATCDAAIYRDMNQRIRERCDIVLNNSTGGGVRRHDPRDLARQLGNRLGGTAQGMDAGAEMCTLDATTLNLAFGDREYLMNTP